MGLYFTVDDTNLTPFLVQAQIVLSIDARNDMATVLLQEMPGRFAAEFDDLSVYFDSAPGPHAKFWQTEGADIIVHKFFAGLVVDWDEVSGAAESPQNRRYELTIQGYDGAALDSVIKGQPGITIPSGTFAAQVSYALAQYNSGAALEIDDSGVENLTGSHTYSAVTFTMCSLRQVLRTLTARAVAYDPTLVPYFTVAPDHTTGTTEFGGPVLYVINAAAAGTATTEFSNDATGTQWSTIGELRRTVVGRPPFANKAYGLNIGGKYQVATATGASSYTNPFNPAETWDTVITNMGNSDSEMAGEVGRLAAQHSTPREQLRFASFGRAKPGEWVTVYDSRLHGYSSGKTVIITDVLINWVEKTFDTTFNGRNIGNPVTLSYTASTSAPELDNSENGPDLQLVLANTPSTGARNTLAAPDDTSTHDLLTTNNTATGETKKQWIDKNGVLRPYEMAAFWASSGVNGFKMRNSADFRIADTDGTGTLSYTVNGSTVSAPTVLSPLHVDKGDYLEITAASVAGHLALTLTEEAQ